MATTDSTERTADPGDTRDSCGVYPALSTSPSAPTLRFVPREGPVDDDALDLVATALRIRYQLGRRLGAGGMAVVHAAQDLRLRRSVAIKVFSNRTSRDPGLERFVREIRTMGTLDHPNALPLLDSGVAAGRPYYVMPLVEAGSLRSLLDNDRRLPTKMVISILCQIMSVLEYAHGCGIIHRDIKPDNVMMRDGHVLLADFGIHKVVGEHPSNRLSLAGSPVGTPTYMSPEQARGDEVIDHRSDIYSVGVLAYELLSGRPVFQCGTAELTMAAHRYQQPIPVSRLRRDIPRRLARLVMKCLEKSPDARWQSAMEITAELVEIESALQTSGMARMGRAVRHTLARVSRLRRITASETPAEGTAH